MEISIKDYASSRGKSVQAVHQQMGRKTNAAALKGHIILRKINGKSVKFLDEEAVAILDASSRSTPSVIVQEAQGEALEQLQQENKTLLIKVAAQADRISELEGWKAEHALMLAEARHQQVLLEERTQRVEQLEAAVRQQEAELQEMRQAGFWRRLRGWKKG